MDLIDDNDDEYILFIENIKLSDINTCKNGIHQNSNEIDDNLLNILKSHSGENYDKIPVTFSNINEWTKKTNLKCWNCSLNFDSIPVFIPVNIYSKNGILLQDVHGNFCSFNCAKSYLNLHFIGDNFIYNQNLLNLYELFYNKTIIDIEEAPSKFDLDIYGGYLNIDEFKNKLKNLINHEY